MIVHASHLKDDHLVECYFAARAGEPLDPRVVEHLGDCAACEARFDDLREAMNGLREDADAETAAVFTDDRLRSQQQQILHRLQDVPRAARVISFPGRQPASSPSHATVRVAPRWLAAAAAACLVVGAGLGAYVGPRRTAARPATVPAAVAEQRPAAVVASPAVLVSATKTEPDDDAFLIELELALAAPRSRELQPFDALTPHVRDIDFRER